MMARDFPVSTVVVDSIAIPAAAPILATSSLVPPVSQRAAEGTFKTIPAQPPHWALHTTSAHATGVARLRLARPWLAGPPVFKPMEPAGQDPAEWPGTSPLPVPNMQVALPRPAFRPVVRKRRMHPTIAGNAVCPKCRVDILGVLVWEDGQYVHFGCATEDTREAVVAGRNTAETSCSSAPTITAMFVAWRRASLLARSDIFKQFCFDCQFAPFPQQHLEVSRAFVLSNPVLESFFESAKNDLVVEDPRVHRLYHGTSDAAAQEICANGFKLPPRAGMFGEGLYFTNVPHKTLQYAHGGFVLVCDVALGRTKRFERGMNLLKGAPEGYDSVTGLTREEGGTLRSPEFVVYNTSQVLPRYLLVLRARMVGES